jgi:acetyl esterase
VVPGVAEAQAERYVPIEELVGQLYLALAPVTATRYSGIIHDFVMLRPLAATHAARAATAQGAEFLHQALDHA